MFPEEIIYFAVLGHLVAYIFYFKSIFSGHTKPNLVSWVIWALAPLIATFFQIKAGAGLVAIPTFLAGFGPFLVVIVAFFRKDFYWKLQTFDLVCGAFAVVALLLYVVTHNLSISIFFAILSDGLACIPTIAKSWKFPETETSFPYFAGIWGNTIALLIITNWSFTIYSFSVYNILINIVILFSIYGKKLAISRHKI